MKTIMKIAEIFILAILFLLFGCDSGRQAVDEVTGNRAVKQYHQSVKDLDKVANQQKARYDGIPEDEGR